MGSSHEPTSVKSKFINEVCFSENIYRLRAREVGSEKKFDSVFVILYIRIRQNLNLAAPHYWQVMVFFNDKQRGKFSKFKYIFHV